VRSALKELVFNYSGFLEGKASAVKAKAGNLRFAQEQNFVKDKAYRVAQAKS